MNQTQPDELDQILTNALQASTELRQKAEENINRLAQENLGLFLLKLSLKLSNEQITSPIRQISSTLIKNFIQKLRQEWLSLSLDLKSKIKEHVLSTLASKQIEIRKAAALTIAGICRVELPLNQWSEIVSVLVSTSNNENFYIQLSSLTTLGFIFQEISPGDIPENDIANLLNCFYTILNKETSHSDVVMSALYAMEYFIPFITGFLSDKTQRTLFFDLIGKYITHSEEEFRHGAILIFLDLMRYAYDSFKDYIDTLTDFTIVIIQKDKEDHLILCYEIWCSIGDTEVKRLKHPDEKYPCLNFCEKASFKLLPLIFHHLITNDYYDDGWTSFKAASTLLEILAQCCSYQVIQKVIQYIGENVNSNDYKHKHAALAAFQAILGTTHKTQISELVIKSLDLINQCLTEPSYPNHIKEVSASVIKTIAEHYANYIIAQPALLDKLIIPILESINSKVSKASVVSLCHSLSLLCQSLNKDSNQQPTNILSKYMELALTKLINQAFDKDAYDYNNNIALYCFHAMANLIEIAATDTENIQQHFFQRLIQAFQTTMTKGIFSDDEKRYGYQNSICFVLISFTKSAQLSSNAINTIINLVFNSFIERKAVYSEGLQCLGMIALYLQEQFTEHMPKVTVYLISVLENHADAALCKKGIIFLSELITSIKVNFTAYHSKYIPLIMSMLSNPDVNKELKLFSFNIISDFFFHCPNDAIPYFNRIMTLIGSALQAALTLPKTEEIDMIEYFAELREHLIETITVIFSVLYERQRTQDFVMYVTQIVQFIMKINTDEYTPTESIFKGSLGILSDLCKAYTKDMKPLLDVPMIEKIIAALRVQAKDPQVTKLIAVAQQNFNEVYNTL